MNDATRPLLLLISQDLFFSTGIEDAAIGEGWRFQLVDQPEQLAAAGGAANRPVPLTEPLEGADAGLVQTLSAWRPGMILIDMTTDGMPWARWIQVLKTSAATRRIPIVAFGPHVDAAAFERATDAGADVRLARGQLRQKLPALLGKHGRQPDAAKLRSACQAPLSEKASAGIRLHNAGDFYEAHELLEEAWMDEEGEAGYLYRALLQITVAHLHISRDNERGARKMLLRLHQWLDPLPAVCRGVDVDGLRRIVRALHDGLESHQHGSLAESELNRIHPFELVGKAAGG